MSIFSKLFPNVKGEADASSPTTSATGEEGPSMKRSPGDGRAPSPGSEGRGGDAKGPAPAVARPEPSKGVPPAPVTRSAAARPQPPVQPPAPPPAPVPARPPAAAPPAPPPSSPAVTAPAAGSAPQPAV